MSIEQQIEALTQALNANTQAILGNVGTSSTPTTATPQSMAPLAAVQPVAAAPATIGSAAPTTQPAAAPAAAAPPSSVPSVTLDQLKQEVTAVYQAKNGDPSVMATVGLYGVSLSDVAPEQYGNLIADVRAL